MTELTKHILKELIEATEEIPVSAPDISALEQEYVAEAMRSGWISSLGPFVEKFEAAFAAMCGTKYALGVTSGTTALHLALLGLDLRPGDEVLVPSFTFVATANAVRYIGAEPVFVDIDPLTWCIDPTKIEAAITRKTRGIIPVHIYGHPADMDAINHIAAVHGLWVVEDAAEAHLARYKGRVTGGLAKIGAFSFYGNKILTSGEGGAVTFDDPHLYKRLKALRGQGADPERRYYFPTVGHNFRITNIACAILCAQLERANEIIRRRREIFARYELLLAGCPGIELQPIASYVKPAPWLFSILIDEKRLGVTRDDVIASLKEQRIDTRPFFMPLHRLPPYRDEAMQRGTSLPITDEVARRGINLPTYSALRQEDQERITNALARRMS